MLVETLSHLLDNVLPSADEYQAAEEALSVAFKSDQSPESWRNSAIIAKRRAAGVAIAIDGLTDRSEIELGVFKTKIRREISSLCFWPGGTTLRAGAHNRVRAVANAYKHKILSDQSLPISSDDDVLVVGSGFGLDGYGVGKNGTPETLVKERNGDQFKFLGDVPVSIGAWFKFLERYGVEFPFENRNVCGMQVYPI
ncbi:hypothetical protein [Oceanibaculum nanhaiense]|uniref:hypothetical protein n=1 Tax=Oceanibaculum nanhaiense TaxID=1909734 RepID=UPI003D277E42